MGEWRIGPPPDLRAWQLDLDDDVFVLLEWCPPEPVVSPELTAAEQDVLRGILAGASNRATAKRRRTTPGTVANQVASLFRKLGVHSRAELIARVVRRDGFVSAGAGRKRRS